MAAQRPDAPKRLPLRWGLILLVAGVVGMVIGLLTFAQSTSWPTALLAALGAAAVAVPVLHDVLGE